MLLHEMNYVYEVYRQRSFTKAAQALYIAQPSLSQMVRKAEARIGAPIFDRSTSPIGVTELGRAYIRAAEQVLQIEADLQQYLDDTEKCLTGALTLGGTTFFTSYVLPPLVSAYSERYPGVELRLHEAHTGQLKQELQEGTLDFALDNTLLDPAIYEAVEIQTEQVILAVPRALPVNEKAAAFRLSAKELPQAFRWSCLRTRLFCCSRKAMTPADGLNNCALRLALSQKYGWRWISSWRPTIWPVTGWARPLSATHWL